MPIETQEFVRATKKPIDEVSLKELLAPTSMHVCGNLAGFSEEARRKVPRIGRENRRTDSL